MLRRLSHEPLTLQQNIRHIVGNHSLNRACEVSSGKARVAFRGIWTGVIDAKIHLDKRSHRLQCLRDLLFIPARYCSLCVLS